MLVFVLGGEERTTIVDCLQLPLRNKNNRKLADLFLLNDGHDFTDGRRHYQDGERESSDRVSCSLSDDRGR